MEFEAMTGSDWMLLEFEYPDTPMHTLKMVVVDGAGRGRPVTLDEVAAVVPRYLDLSPRFTSRAEKRAGRWLWIRQPLRISDHLDERTLGSPDAFDDLCSALSQEQLDRSRPLWAITLVHGLAEGRQAIVVRVHHALMDGSSAQRIFTRVTNTEPGVPAPLPEPSTLLGPEYRAPLPRRLYDVAGALADVLRQSRRYGPDKELIPHGMVRRSQLNQRSAGGRLCAVSELPLADFRELASLTGTNVNGAVHGVITRALRARMLADGVQPTEPLVGSFGVIEDRSLERYAGNNLATARYWLHVEEPDPVRAVQRVGASCAETVLFRRARGFRLQTLGSEFGRFIPPLRNRFVHLWPLTPIHLLTAYVSGPQEQRWLGDVEVVSWISIAVSIELTNVNVVAYTYAGKVAFGLITTPESMPDPAGFLRLLGTCLEELLEVARVRAS
ncbi:diacylglycerol O-acyltransferase [Marmoricola sp. OAE513]|uniref:wax ester/triacylglycerol synthase domain-containing protein n=1 Tax=Marmoricola sp. OAE513 TaxID=2817894 RepID=UPI001AE2FEC9